MSAEQIKALPSSADTTSLHCGFQNETDKKIGLEISGNSFPAPELARLELLVIVGTSDAASAWSNANDSFITPTPEITITTSTTTPLRSKSPSCELLRHITRVYRDCSRCMRYSTHGIARLIPFTGKSF